MTPPIASRPTCGSTPDRRPRRLTKRRSKATSRPARRTGSPASAVHAPGHFRSMRTRIASFTAAAVAVILFTGFASVASVAGASPASAAPTDAAAPPPVPIPTATDRWMGDYGDVIGQRLLTQVVLPGTHDSATATLDRPATHLQNDPNLGLLPEALAALGPLGPVTIGNIVSDWSIAQDQTILQQLDGGVRYLDLRFCWDSVTQVIRVCHGAFGAELGPTIDDIASFVNAPGHDKEIIVVDVDTDDLAGSSCPVPGAPCYSIDQVFNTIQAKLGSHLVPDGQDLTTLTVGQLWAKHQQVIVMSNTSCSDGQLCNGGWEPWNRGAVLKPEPLNGGQGTLDPATREMTASQTLEADRGSPPAKMLSIGTALTPTVGYIVAQEALCQTLGSFGPWDCSLLQLGKDGAPRMNDVMNWWAYNQYSARENMNIIAVDSYEYTNVVHQAILMNAGPVAHVDSVQNSDGTPYQLSTWRGGQIRLNASCATQPAAQDLGLDPPANTGSTISTMGYAGASGSGSNSGATMSDRIYPGNPVTVNCVDEYGKTAYIPLPAFPFLSSVALGVTPPSPAAGTYSQVSAVGTFADQQTADVSRALTYTFTSPSGKVGSCPGQICYLTEAGQNTITATAPLSMSSNDDLDTPVSATTIVNVRPGAAFHLAASPASSTEAAGSLQPYTITATDAFGNTSDVTPAAQLAITPVSAGSATGTACNTSGCIADVAGNYQVTATLNQAGYLPLTATANLTVTPAAPASIALSPATASITAGTTLPYIVTGTDVYGNTFAVSVPPAQLLIGPTRGGSATGAACSPTGCTATVAGTYLVEAVLARSALPPLVTPAGSLTVLAGAPATVTATSGGAQSATSGSAFPNPLVVAVVDAYGNPVPGAAVTFQVASGSATFPGGTASASVTTTANGGATSPILTAGPSAGPVTVTASSGAVSGPSAAVYLETVIAAGPAKSDLSVILSAPTTAPHDTTIITALTVNNAGPSPSGRYGAALIVPRGFTVTNPGGGTLSHSAVIFTGTTLGAGKTISYTVTLKADATAKGYALLGASALAATADPNYRNNLALTLIKIT